MMRRVKKAISILLTLAMTLVLFPATASAGLADYDYLEYLKLRNFLEQESNVAGKSNGQMISYNYDPDDPDTWEGITWTDSSTKRAYFIDWENKSLAGDLDVSDFEKLYELNCADNKIKSINAANAENLAYVYCQNNLITQLNLEGCVYLYELNCSNNMLMTLDVNVYWPLYLFDCRYNPLTFISYHNYYSSTRFRAIGNGYIGFSAGYQGEIRGFYSEARALPSTRFTEWQKDDNTYSTDPNAFLESYDDTVFYAVFEGGSEPEPSVSPSEVPEEPTPSVGPSETPEEPKPSVTPTCSPEEPSQAPTPIPTPYPYRICIVEFRLNGGTYLGGANLEQHLNEGSDAVAPLVEKSGYTLVGWDTDFTNVTQNLVVTAIWEENVKMHTVTFDLNQGTRTGGGELIQKVADQGAAIAPEVVREGYSFVGWDVSFDHITEDLKVTAIWNEDAPVVEVMTYRIQYDTNGGDGPVPIDDNEYMEGDIAILDDGSDLSLEGYEFAGWSLDRDGAVITDYEVTVDGDMIFYAIWQEVEYPEEEEETVVDPGPEEVIELPKTGLPSAAYTGVTGLLFGTGASLIEVIRRKRKKIK